MRYLVAVEAVCYRVDENMTLVRYVLRMVRAGSVAVVCKLSLNQAG